MAMRECFLYGRKFQFEPNAYLGKRVKAWDVTVRNDCYAAQRGGIVPTVYPHLAEHLQARGVTLEYDEQGGIRWPLPN